MVLTESSFLYQFQSTGSNCLERTEKGLQGQSQGSVSQISQVCPWIQKRNMSGLDLCTYILYRLKQRIIDYVLIMSNFLRKIQWTSRNRICLTLFLLIKSVVKVQILEIRKSSLFSLLSLQYSSWNNISTNGLNKSQNR